jgi:hypothetical protein
MIATDFNQLPLETKIQWVYFEGEFIMDIRYYEFKINLYRIKDFLIEVFYHHKSDLIQKVVVLDKKCNRMKFYADQVKLQSIS